MEISEIKIYSSGFALKDLSSESGYSISCDSQSTYLILRKFTNSSNLERVAIRIQDEMGDIIWDSSDEGIQYNSIIVLTALNAVGEAPDTALNGFGEEKCYILDDFSKDGRAVIHMNLNNSEYNWTSIPNEDKNWDSVGSDAVESDGLDISSIMGKCRTLLEIKNTLKSVLQEYGKNPTDQFDTYPDIIRSIRTSTYYQGTNEPSSSLGQDWDVYLKKS